MLDENECNNNTKSISKEVKIVEAMLNQAGIFDYHPVIVEQLLFYMYDHVTNVLENAKVFSKHASKSNLDKSDISLALLIQKEHEPIPRQVIFELAKERNFLPLQENIICDGLRLPPEKQCLTSTNYKLKLVPKTFVPIPLIVPKKHVLHNAQHLIPAQNNPNSLLKRSNFTSPYMGEQRIIFQPRLKINIKSQENEYKVIKKQRTN